MQDEEQAFLEFTATDFSGGRLIKYEQLISKYIDGIASEKQFNLKNFLDLIAHVSSFLIKRYNKYKDLEVIMSVISVEKILAILEKNKKQI